MTLLFPCQVFAMTQYMVDKTKFTLIVINFYLLKTQLMTVDGVKFFCLEKKQAKNKLVQNNSSAAEKFSRGDGENTLVTKWRITM